MKFNMKRISSVVMLKTNIWQCQSWCGCRREIEYTEKIESGAAVMMSKAKLWKITTNFDILIKFDIQIREEGRSKGR